MENKNLALGGIVMLFIGIIFAFALIPAIFSAQSTLTDKSVVANDSISAVGAYVDATHVNESFPLTIYAQASTDWQYTDCPLTSVVLRNGAGTALVATTDYVLDDAAGTFTLKDTAKTQPGTSLNITYSDYTFCQDGYNTDSGSRSVAGIIGIFVALALLGFVLEKSGVINLTGK